MLMSPFLRQKRTKRPGRWVKRRRRDLATGKGVGGTRCAQTPPPCPFPLWRPSCLFTGARHADTLVSYLLQVFFFVLFCRCFCCGAYMAHICVKDIDVMDLDDGCWDGALHCKGGMDVSGWRAPVKRQAGRRMGREEGGGV